MPSIMLGIPAAWWLLPPATPIPPLPPIRLITQMPWPWLPQTATIKKLHFSNYGNWVDIAAPGVSIYSTAPNHSNKLKIYNYAYLSVTSMATPYVAGLSALLASVGNLTQTEIV